MLLFPYCSFSPLLLLFTASTIFGKPVWFGLHVISDALIALAYYLIPIVLIFVRKRVDLLSNRTFLLLGTFIITCGTTYILEIWTLWHPTYWLSGALKVLTALISILTALLLLPLILKALDLPDPAQLELANLQLQEQIIERQKAEAALQNSETELRSIFAAMTELIMVFDGQGRHLKIASTNQEILYKNIEERIGKTLHDVFAQEQADFFLGQIRQALETQTPLDIEYSIEIDGKEIWSAATISPLTSDSIVWVARDITARKQAEAAVHKQQEFLNAVLSNVEDGILACDANGVLTLFNKSVESLHILPQIELPPEQWSEYYNLYVCDGKVITTKDDILLYRALQGEYIHNLEVTIAPKDDVSRTVLASGQPILDPEANKLGAVIVMRDITKHKQAEELLHQVNEELELRVKKRTTDLNAAIERLEAEIVERQQVEAALRESEQQFRATFNQAAVGIAQTDVDGHWLLINQRFCDITGYSFNDLRGLTFKDITHPEDLSLDLELYEQLLAGTIPILSINKRYLRKNGNFVWISLTVSLVRDMNGDPKYTIAILEDISQRKQIEENIQKSLEGERELSQLKSRFIETVSHELRTPLTTIASSIELLESKNYELNDARRIRHFKQINSSVSRINYLIEDALAVIKLQDNEQFYPLSSINLNQFCEKSVRQWQVSVDGKRKLVFEDCSEIKLITQLNEELLEKVFTQLILNAIRYSPQGSDILVQLHAQNQTAAIIVQDQGIGIPPEEQARIFDRFYRASNANLIPGTPGVGIGLAIAQEALTLQGGTIAVKSEVSKGSTFIVTLPLDISLLSLPPESI